MGIFEKFQNPQATKELEDELKSKVGIKSEQDEEIGLDVISTENEPSGEQSPGNQGTIGEGEREPSDKEATDSQAQGLDKKIKNPITKKGEQSGTEVSPPAVDEPSEGNEEISQDLEELEAFINSFKKSYKQSVKENRMLRLQQKNYEKLLKLKLGKVSISQFVNFAIAYSLNSKHYKHIVKLLNQPKDG